VAMDADGNFVVTWVSADTDGSGNNVYARRFSAGSTSGGTEFRVNTYTPGSQTTPAVAMDEDGSFVVAWGGDSLDDAGSGIHGRRYAAGSITGSNEFRINPYTTGTQSSPAVAMAAEGAYVVTWHSNGESGDFDIYGRRFNAGSSAGGSEFRVNAFTTDNQFAASVAMDDEGAFVVAWFSAEQDGNSWGIFAQAYTDDGDSAGTEFQVNLTTSSAQVTPVVAMDADGDFVISWLSNLQDGSFYGVFGRRFIAGSGGSEFQVNVFTTGFQNGHAIAMDDDGDFIITWGSANRDGDSNGIGGRLYARSNND
ncbi:MAG TPA: hypothetical protein V6D23_18060, partial [Candidatus Obscuribacterales bacterium]